MLSIDTNLLLYAYSEAAPEHDRALAFITSMSASESVALSEFVLTEFYLLLRNPTVLKKPLTAPDAVRVIQSYRQHPRWKILGFPPTSREVHADLWQQAATPGIARRRIYDTRTALCLRAFGVTEFATAKVKDFEGFGFQKVWNPLI
ncbi:TA system VapC family ribonuclease toxin [Prosthecobacter sp.]|jgi:toxin-antitoxin system PIN domain toxin|uniref:TA system VapC family ribonuclease toxin n=1 Tax=Prosthecobacter sp. TaxID=1965333 RepID=UPI0037C63CE3